MSTLEGEAGEMGRSIQSLDLISCWFWKTLVGDVCPSSSSVRGCFLGCLGSHIGLETARASEDLALGSRPSFSCKKSYFAVEEWLEND
jgi:hypothetical protein